MQAERAALATQRAGRGEAGNLRIGYTSTCAFTPIVLDVLRRYQAAHGCRARPRRDAHDGTTARPARRPNRCGVHPFAAERPGTAVRRAHAAAGTAGRRLA